MSGQIMTGESCLKSLGLHIELKQAVMIIIKAWKKNINITIISFYFQQGCSKLFASEANAHPLATLDLSASSSKGIPYLPDKPYNCKVKSAEYLDITWKQLPKKEADTFSLKRTSSWYKNELLVGT